VFVVFAAEGALVCRSGLGREERGGRRESARACVREKRKETIVSSFCCNGFSVWLFPSSTVPLVLRAGVASEDGSNSVASSSFQS
jgi:hypothetical protein